MGLKQLPIILIAAVVLTTQAHQAQPFNPRMWGFSSYIGPVVNLTYNDTGLQRVLDVVPIGTLRYPGGSIANNWNLTSGRWYNVSSIYAQRTAAFPEGTFSADVYYANVGRRLATPPIWNLNVDSFNQQQMLDQLDALKRFNVPVSFLEMGNEKAGGCADSDYLQKIRPLVSKARRMFPKARLGIIGNWQSPGSGPPDWTECAKALGQHRDLFDDVTVHQYEPSNVTIVKYRPELQAAVTLAATVPILHKHASTVRDYIGPNVTIWLDEFNWGGNWVGAVTWPQEIRGSLRGLLHVSYILAAINEGPIYSSLNRYSLFHQNLSDWSHWSSSAHVSDFANRPQDVAVSADLQIYTHFAHIALRNGLNFTHMAGSPDAGAAGQQVLPVSVYGNSSIPCLMSAVFWHDGEREDSEQSVGLAIATLNVCNQALNATQVLPASEGISLTCSSYRAWSYPANLGSEYGAAFVAMDDVDMSSLPWKNGPAKWNNVTVRAGDGRLKAAKRSQTSASDIVSFVAEGTSLVLLEGIGC